MDDPLDRADQTTIDVFDLVDIRVGRVVACDLFPEARNPAYKLTIDFGPIGIKRSSAQLTTYYTADDLLGQLVLAVVNFPPRKIAGFMSEVLVLGLPGEGISRQSAVVLLQPERPVELGARVF